MTVRPSAPVRPSPRESLAQLAYSLRRYYVDEFFLKSVGRFPKDALVLDMGGIATGKRGLFDVGEYGLRVHYANISRKAHPHVLCDLCELPIRDCVYDGVILSEVLEHVFEPGLVLREAFRVLKPGGCLLMCTPFLFHVHPDPCDFARYTGQYYERLLSSIGFTSVRVEKQGLLCSVLANMIKCWAFDLANRGRPRSGLLRVAFHRLIHRFELKALEMDNQERFTDSPVFSGHTTGYGVVCEKAGVPAATLAQPGAARR